MPSANDLPGRVVTSPLGAFQLIEAQHPAHNQHGALALGGFLRHTPTLAAQLARDEALAALDLRDLAFVDTETTGLAGGAGTLAFLVGVGVWEGEVFCLRQYFLREPGDEEALLHALAADLAPRAGWITFNGKAFDLPLLESRLVVNRMRGAWGVKPHLDLLTPARRLYRGRLPSCALGDLERAVLGLMREQDDVSGELIPTMYQAYLRTGDASEMRRVLYHNAMDVLSMVTLADHLLTAFADPASAEAIPTSADAALTRLRLALWHDDSERPAEAEAAYQQALRGPLDLEARSLGLTRYAALLKRVERRAEAAALWEQLAAFTLDDPEPFVELAKYHEWHTRDLAQAIRWTERALAVVAGWPNPWQRADAQTALQHRLERLQHKRASA